MRHVQLHVGGWVQLLEMNVLPAREAFHEAVRRLQLPRSSTVGKDLVFYKLQRNKTLGRVSLLYAVVGLSGGPDSVALAFLARQAFSRVVAVTVDHR